MSERFGKLGELKSAYQNADPDSFGLYLGAEIKLPTERDKRQHFAIIKSDPKLAKRVSQLGICPVLAPSYSMIAAALDEVYCAALDESECACVGMIEPKAYWKRLEYGPEKKPGKNQDH